MSEFFIGQIMMSAFGYAPKFFAHCNGQLLPINQNQALFSLLGTQYGGNGSTNFALPDLRGRTPVGYPSSVDPAWQPAPTPIGGIGGVESVALLPTHMPPHSHQVAASSAAGNSRVPTGRTFATSTNSNGNAIALYAGASGPVVALDAQTVVPSGGGQAHPNMQPYTGINFCIALSGIFPSRN
ncbi:phage tail protein [Luteimonas kalidii]|uniref:Tail fiber protein n=1 Tax=Luteimonas kalidii TaxID=3042025 RepID=A0ABT6JTV1_9GAMM|nr:tail fiber protein [Luteimonas kalidii]MDH5833376.1 tail fiber protein [Luteimonas kalidii]